MSQPFGQFDAASAGWLALVVIGVLVSLPAPATAETFSCDSVDGEFDEGWEGVERIPHAFGAERAVLLERCRRWAGHAYWYQRVDISVWENGEKLVEQTLFNGMTSDTGIDYSLQPEVGRFELEYGCGGSDGPEVCRRSWTWSSIYDRLIEMSVDSETRKSEQYYLRRFQTSLARNDYDEASGALRRIAGASGPENADWHMRLNRRFLREVARRAAGALEAGEKERARDLAEQAFLQSLPSDWDSSSFDKKEVWEVSSYQKKRRGDSVEFGRTETFILRRDEGNARLTDRLADILQEAGRSSLAVRVRSDCLETFTHRLATRLKLADALWELDRKAEARMHYAKYAELAGDRGRGDLPDRVVDRREAP